MMPTLDARLGDRFSIVLPLFHVAGLISLLFMVYGGGTSILMRTFDPAQMWKITADEKITATFAVPAMLNFMLMIPNVDPEGYSQLRWIMSGAAPVPIALIKQYQDIEGLGMVTFGKLLLK